MSRHESKLTIQHGALPRTAEPEQIKAEPMFFRATVDFALANGGDLTHRFVDEAFSLWGDLSDVIIDSRHHMLMPGMFPCIPGWHTDDAPRDQDKWGGQPNIFDPEYVTEHLLCIVDSGTGSLTEFLKGEIEMPESWMVRRFQQEGSNFYKSADKIIETYEPGTRVYPRTGDIVEFDSHTWHRGTPARARGFRWFIRMTRNSKHQAQNEIRSNAQVYITDTSYGW